jgi:hypothetical protein
VLGCQYEYRYCDLYYERCSEAAGGVCTPLGYALCPCFDYISLVRSYQDRCYEYIAPNPNAPGKKLEYWSYPSWYANLATWDETNRICAVRLRSGGGYTYSRFESEMREEDWNLCMTFADQYIEDYGITCTPNTDP